MSIHQDSTLFGTGSGTLPVAARQVAVIDIGTSSIRMAVGEIDERGTVRTLESLSRAVPIGKDTFTSGSIRRSTIEDCVKILSSYVEILEAYGIAAGDQLRCVATSAVREADNRLAFIDRIFIATGIQVEPLDEAEVSRITFLGVQPTLRDQDLANSRSIVVEVGGGSTEFLVVQAGQVVFSHTYNLGSLRIREMLESLRAPQRKERKLMENHIGRYVTQARQQIHAVQSDDVSTELIALGGDFRFAATQLVPDRVEDSLAAIPIADYEQFVEKTFPLPIDELVQEYHLSFPDAETLGPALLSMLHIARAFDVTQLRVSNVNLRDGLLQELASQGVWSDDFQNQVVHSATDLARKYGADVDHARHVAHMAGLLFDALKPQHRLDDRYRLIVTLAALLHEIGMFVAIGSYHKHSQYLIENTELFGFSRRDLRLLALVARYHRRASPKPSHSAWSSLDRGDRVIVAKLASILRVADALDRSYSQRVREFSCSISRNRLVISIPGVEDLSLEQLALKECVRLFEETYGLKVLLRQSRL